VSKSFGGSFTQGGFTTLTITISNPNSGGADLTDVGIVDNLPSSPGQMTLTNNGNTGTPTVSVTGCGATASLSDTSGGTSLTLSNATIPPGTSCTVVVDVTAPAPGMYTNTTNPVTTSAGTFGTATATVTVAQIP
jgi:hypothetical protein